MDDKAQQIERLIERAATATKSEDAMRFSQAACNSANAMRVLKPATPAAEITDGMVTRFLTWPLPASVCSDLCATQQGRSHRTGTALLTAIEARQMLEHVLKAQTD